jgi:hypothetical protein
MLFPYLQESPGDLWQAFAEIQSRDTSLLFHGHTHVQAAWRWAPDEPLRQIWDDVVQMEAGVLYVVGVGSVGLPEDGAWSAYAVYDADERHLELVRLDWEPGRRLR